MILLFNKIPISLKKKISIMLDTVYQALGSEFFNVSGSRWLGDNLTTESLFPKWITKKSKENPSDVLIVEIIKSYQRWLFSVERGYGAAVPWETIRVAQKIPDKLLLGFADLYFPSQDFSSEDLNDLLPNIRKFSIHCQENYFHKKGTPDAIKYLLVTLLNLPTDQCDVVTGSPGFIIVRANVPEKYKNFLNKCVYPAGMTILYETP